MQISFYEVELEISSDCGSRDKDVEWVNFAITEHDGDKRDLLTMFPTKGRFAFLEDLYNQIETELERLMKLGDPKLEQEDWEAHKEKVEQGNKVSL